MPERWKSEVILSQSFVSQNCPKFGREGDMHRMLDIVNELLFEKNVPAAQNSFTLRRERKCELRGSLNKM